VCDDVAGFRTLLRHALEEDADMQVVGEAGDGTAAVRGVGETQPDAVLLDLSMPGMDGFEALPQLAQQAPRTAVVVVSGFGAEQMADLALNRNAVGYVEKGESFETIRAVVREVVTHRENVEAMRRLYAAYADGDIPRVLEHMHPEVEVIPLPDIAPEPYRGHEGIRQCFHDAAAWDELKYTVHQFRAAEDRVVMLGRYRSRRAGSMVDSPAAWVQELRDGKIVRSESYTSWEQALDAVGLAR
jgi:DNA-binding NarL/FixJ family response regulator